LTREAVTLIHEYAGGIPRTISVICDNALVAGMALGRRPLDRAIILEVCQDLRLSSRRERPSSAPSGLPDASQDSSPPVAEREETAELEVRPAHAASSSRRAFAGFRVPTFHRRPAGGAIIE